MSQKRSGSKPDKPGHRPEVSQTPKPPPSIVEDAVPVDLGSADTVVLRLRSMDSGAVDNSSIMDLMKTVANELNVNVIALPSAFVDGLEIHDSLDSVEQRLEEGLRNVREMIENQKEDTE
jgi:hypothetical protein